MQVIDADFGYTGGNELSSTLKLEAGLHPFTLGYRRGSGGTPSLGLSWSGPSVAKQAIPESAFVASAGEEPQGAAEKSIWLFGEGSGTTTSEQASGVTSDAFGTGVTWSSDTPGAGSSASLSFNGATTARFGVNINAADIGIDGAGAKTIVGWINTTQIDKRYFWGWSPGNGLIAGGDLRFAIENNGKLCLEVSGGYTRYDGISLNDGNWHMVAAIINPNDSVDGVDFYIDGNLYTPTANNTQLINTSGAGDGGVDTPNKFFFGSSGNTTDEQWIGGIDDFRIYPSALTEAELDAIFTAMTLQTPTVEWPLDEGGEATTSESMTGTVSDPLDGGIAWSTDTPGTGSSASLSFDGSSGLSTNLDSTAAGIDGSGAKTISAWIKTGTTSDAAFFGYSPTNGSSPGADVRLLVNAAGQLRFEANVGNFAVSSASVNDNVWHFVALVIAPGATAANVSFYLDGSLSTPGISSGTATLNTATGNEIWIGSDGIDGRYFNGLIDHVRIHDRVLDLAELNALRSAGVGASTATGFASWIGGLFPGDVDPATIGFGFDPDEDGVANGLEYYLGGDSDPSAPGPVTLPSATLDGAQLLFTFTRRDGAQNPGIIATVESGADLTSWTDSWQIGPDTTSSSPGVTIEENGSEDDTITVAIPLDIGTRRFVRLVVSETP